MKRTVCAVAVISLLAMGGASAAGFGLPKVTLSPCATLDSIQSEANVLFPLLGAVINPDPVYATMDLDADGIPDSYEIALLAEGLCAGDVQLNGQFNANKAVFATLVADVTNAVNIIVGPPRVDARLSDVAGIIAGHPELMAVPEIAAAQAELVTVAGQVAGLLNGLDPAILTAALGLLPHLIDYSDLAVAIAGLSSEMQAPVTGILTQYAPDIQSYLTTATQVIAAGQALLQPPLSGFLTPTEVTTITGVLTDAQSLVPAVQRTLDLPTNLQIYGVFHKTVSEPYSGVADYDGDGFTNAVVWDAVKTSPTAEKDFIEAASGYNPFFTGNPGLPVVGLIGLAAMAGAVALAGARSMRKK